MSLFDLSKRRWLFCMTHPDDEISVCAWIRHLAQNGNEVFTSWTHSTPIREGESRKVAKFLGVPQEHLTFFGATDGNVSGEFKELLPRFRELIDRVKPDVVVCGAFEQGHPDHDTTNVLVNSTFAGEVLEVPFYHTYATKLQTMNTFSDPTGQSINRLSSEDIQLKRQVAKLFPSQNIWRVLLSYEVWQITQGKRSSLSTREVMRLQGHKLFRVPSHPISLAKRVEQSETWLSWCDQVLPHIRG